MKIKHFLLLLVLALSLASCSSDQVKDGGSADIDNYEVPNLYTEVEQGDFVYRLVTDKKEYNKGESIAMYAELEYIGEKKTVTIFHASSPFHFPMIEKTREFEIPYNMPQPLLSTTLTKGKPIREHYGGSGGYGSEDEKEYIAFMKKVVKGEFPNGYYVIDGFADFYVESEKGENETEYRLKGRIEFIVR